MATLPFPTPEPDSLDQLEQELNKIQYVKPEQPDEIDKILSQLLHLKGLKDFERVKLIGCMKYLGEIMERYSLVQMDQIAGDGPPHPEKPSIDSAKVVQVLRNLTDTERLELERAYVLERAISHFREELNRLTVGIHLKRISTPTVDRDTFQARIDALAERISQHPLQHRLPLRLHVTLHHDPRPTH